MLKSSKRKFGEILVAEGVLPKEDVDAALQEQVNYRSPIGEYLMESGQITEFDLARVFCIQYSLPFMRLQGYELRGDLLKGLPTELLFRNKIVPLDRIGSCCTVAIAMVPPEEIQELLVERLGADVHYILALVSDVDQCLREHFSLSQEEMLTMSSDRPQKPLVTEISSETAGELGDVVTDSWEAIFDEAEKNVSTE